MGVVIETQRLIFKQITHQDLDALLKIYKSPKNMKLVPNAKFDWNKEKLWRKYERLNQNYKNGFGIYTILRKEDQSIIGEAGLYNSFDDEKHLELGYILDHQYWNKAYGTGICQALIKYAFEKLKVEKLTARMIKDNIGSKRVSEKCGMRFFKEGISENGYPFLQYEIKYNSPKSE